MVQSLVNLSGIICLDIYGNPYGVSGAEDNHNDYTYDDNSYN